MFKSEDGIKLVMNWNFKTNEVIPCRIISSLYEEQKYLLKKQRDHFYKRSPRNAYV
jgi:hypothetical protein